MKLQFLLVEDDRDLAATLLDCFELEGIQCDHAQHGLAGLKFATDNRYDLIVLDVAMPKMDGLELCQLLRRRGVDTPVLMLTARDSLADKLAGFDSGTDDYLVKPFALSELLARVRALAKRRSSQVKQLIIGDLCMDLELRRVVRGGKTLKLSPTGLKLLEALLRASPAVVSKLELEHSVWGDSPPDSNSLKVHLHHLRRCVDKEFSNAMIITVPGQGVALRVES